jgi:4-hydroxybenzoate polyprenyltransferase
MARSTISPLPVADASVNEVSGRPVVQNLLTSVRPGQWTKNLLVFAGLVFGHRLFDLTAVADAPAAFAIFCPLSGVVYLLNDVVDRESDRRHPLKAQRPIASGALCTILLALFIVFAKRRNEIVLLASGATSHRPTLGEYSPYLLDQMIAVVAAATLVAYIFYTISPETQEKFGTPWLGLTIPFPLYGIFRYLYLVHQREGGGSPADMLLTDRPLLACVALWVLAVVFIVYAPLAP